MVGRLMLDRVIEGGFLIRVSRHTDLEYIYAWGEQVCFNILPQPSIISRDSNCLQYALMKDVDYLPIGLNLSATSHSGIHYHCAAHFNL